MYFMIITVFSIKIYSLYGFVYLKKKKVVLVLVSAKNIYIYVFLEVHVLELFSPGNFTEYN